MKIKLSHHQLTMLTSLMSEQISQKAVREAIKDMEIEHYIYLHTLSEVVQKLGKKGFDFKENYTLNLSPTHGAALMLGCCIALNTATDPYIINTLRIIISQIEQKL